MSQAILYSYYRSSAAYRVRIALALKDIAYQSRPIHLVKNEQNSADYLAINPQGLIPALLIDDLLLAQSQAIIEYLDETRPDTPFLPKDPAGRALVRRLAQMIVADIHPLNNVRVQSYLRQELNQDDQEVAAWISRWNGSGFAALEALVAQCGGDFCCGDQVTIADLCLVPQMYNARRFSVDITPFPRLQAIDSRCCALAAFAAAHPDRQPDFPPALS